MCFHRLLSPKIECCQFQFAYFWKQIYEQGVFIVYSFSKVNDSIINLFFFWGGWKGVDGEQGVCVFAVYFSFFKIETSQL